MALNFRNGEVSYEIDGQNEEWWPEMNSGAGKKRLLLNEFQKLKLLNLKVWIYENEW